MDLKKLKKRISYLEVEYLKEESIPASKESIKEFLEFCKLTKPKYSDIAMTPEGYIHAEWRNKKRQIILIFSGDNKITGLIRELDDN